MSDRETKSLGGGINVLSNGSTILHNSNLNDSAINKTAN